MVNEKFTILVVDDERSNIDALASILKPLYTVLVAKDGETALKVADNCKPDLILLDVVMPNMNGFEVMAELKKSDALRRIPVIFITGRDNITDEGKGFALGAVDYISKPFNYSIIEARVRTHLQTVEYIRTIEQMCKMDSLTNIPNRRGFDDQCSFEISRAAREKTPLGLLMIDVDLFKNYNDRFGHLQGDVALRNIADTIKSTLKRPADYTARWGGEEFAALLPYTDLNGTLSIAEEIRANVEASTVYHYDAVFSKITVSIGACAAVPSKSSVLQDFIAAADKALYDAKNSGRNIVKSAEIIPFSHQSRRDDLLDPF